MWIFGNLLIWRFPRPRREPGTQNKIEREDAEISRSRGEDLIWTFGNLLIWPFPWPQRDSSSAERGSPLHRGAGL